jgi:hypothetical protein
MNGLNRINGRMNKNQTEFQKKSIQIIEWIFLFIVFNALFHWNIF